MKKNVSLTLMALSMVAVLLGGCEREADVASRNVSRAADEFQVVRRIVFINTWTDSYILSVEGRCSLDNTARAGEFSMTCKHGPGLYKKHFLGLGSNVTYFVQQMEDANVSGDYYKVNFKPTVLLPNLSLNK